MHNQLIKTAELLAKSGTRPRQTDLRRAISTAYYAMFHALAKNNANNFISHENRDGKADRAWQQTYRALEHSNAFKACKRCYNEEEKLGFPKPIIDFARQFVTLQTERHRADYDPTVKYKKQEVINYVESAKTAILVFTKSKSKKHKQAFAALVLFKQRN